MNEAEENAVRNTLSNLRQNDPATFIRLALDALLHTLHDHHIVAIDHKDDADERDALIVVFKGHKIAEWAALSIDQMQRKLADLKQQHEGEAE